MTKGGTVLTIEIKGGQAAAFAALNPLAIFLISNNLGNAKSIVAHPATTMHQCLPADQKAAPGITPGSERGLERLDDPGDLRADLVAALEGLGFRPVRSTAGSRLTGPEWPRKPGI